MEKAQTPADRLERFIGEVHRFIVGELNSYNFSELAGELHPHSTSNSD